MLLRFFFQAEDGIRDGTVTGVQTCALRSRTLDPAQEPHRTVPRAAATARAGRRTRQGAPPARAGQAHRARARRGEIGRASCRERVWTPAVAGARKTTKAHPRDRSPPTYDR